MIHEDRGLTFFASLCRGAAVWVFGGLILWLTELVFALIGLQQSWDFKFVRGGMPVLDALRLTIVTEKTLIALLVYIGAGCFGGGLTACVAFFTSKNRSQLSLDVATMSVFPACITLVCSGLLTGTPLLPSPGLVLTIVIATLPTAVVFVASYLLFKLVITQKMTTPLPEFAATTVFLGCSIFGGSLIAKSAGAHMLTLRSVVLCGALLTVSCGAWWLVIRVFRRRQMRSTAGPTAFVKPVYILAALLTLFALLGIAAKRDLTPEALLHRTTQGTRKSPNIVFIVMDTVRSDHLSCYGYKRDTTPAIDKIADEGTLFKNVISPSSWTLPSHASMFTGLFHAEHGTGHGASLLPSHYETLAQILKQAGYRTLAYSNNPWVSYYTGLSRKFDDFQEGWREGDDRFLYERIYNKLARLSNGLNTAQAVKDHGAAKTNVYVSKWIKKNASSPFFVFINYLEAHMPYAPPPPYNTLYMDKSDNSPAKEGLYPFTTDGIIPFEKKHRSRKELDKIIALYDGEIRYLDDKIEELYKLLQELRLLDNTVIIITSDHGENLGEHDLVGHAYGLFNTLINVPLIIRHPKTFRPGFVVKSRVQTTDIFYTILDEVGIQRNPSPLGMGRSLVKRIAQNRYSDTMLSEHDMPRIHIKKAEELKIDTSPLRKDRKSIIEGRYKYITTSAGDEMLYDLQTDPGELRNIIATRKEIAARMKIKLVAIESKVQPLRKASQGRQFDKETKDRLRALGYIE